MFTPVMKGPNIWGERRAGGRRTRQHFKFTWKNRHERITRKFCLKKMHKGYLSHHIIKTSYKVTIIKTRWLVR